MTNAAREFLSAAFSKAQFSAIVANQKVYAAREKYDNLRRAGKECSLEYAIYCDANREVMALETYASNCLKAIESARLLDITPG